MGGGGGVKTKKTVHTYGGGGVAGSLGFLLRSTTAILYYFINSVV